MKDGRGSDPATETWPLADIPRKAAETPGVQPPGEEVRLGRYALRGQIGRGGMGLVYRAWDPELGREVALKLLFSGQVSDRAQKRRFLREARAVARLRHPHIVEVYDIGEHQGNVFYAMRLIEGENLAQRLMRGPLTEREATRLALQLARALAHAHAHGLVHRDVKPSNVLLDGGDAVLVDFGLVKDHDESVVLTQDGRAMGTPAYMSPEQARGELSAIGPASDQYGLGAVLYEALSGEPPFRGATPLEVMRQSAATEPAPLERSGVDPGLARITRRAMAKAPRDRFADLGELADALERWQEGGEAVSSTSDLTLRMRGVVRRHRSPLLLVALVLGVTAFALGGTQLQARRAAALHEAAAAQRLTVLTESLRSALNQGAEEEARRAFAAFTRSPENQGTEALAAAWLDWGRRMAALDRPEEAREALGVAYVLSGEPEGQDDALVALAKLFREEDDFDRLAPTVATLETRGSPRLAAGTVRELQRDLAVARGDLSAALTLEPRGEDRALIEALAQRTPLGIAGEDAVLWDSDGDGLPELVVFQPEPGRLSLLDPRHPDAPPLAAGPAPPEGLRLGAVPLTVEGHARPTLLLRTGERCVLLERAGDALVEGDGFPCRGAGPAISADLDGDGVLELYVVEERGLLRVGADRVPEPVETTLNRSNSYIYDLASADLDQDGQAELLTASSGWGAYDARALVAQGDQLTLRARARLGVVADVEVLSWAGRPAVAVTQQLDPDTPENPRVFGADLPHAEARGVHLLRLGAEGFTREALFRWPQVEGAGPATQPPASLGGLRAADLDGDGDQELVAMPAQAWTWTFFRRADGSLGELAAQGYVAVDVGDVDGDGDDELVVRGAEAPHDLSIVGMGASAPLAGPRPAPAAPVRPPSDLDAALQQRWARAEELAQIGLAEVAAGQLLEATALATDALTAARLRLRAAALLEGIGALEPALGAYEGAAKAPSLAVEAWEGALRCALADRRPERALQAAQARLALPDPPEGLAAQARALAAWRATTPRVFEFASGVDPLWQVEQATDLRMDAVAGGLRVRSARSADHLRLPLRWDETPKRMRVTLDPQRLDWGANFEVTLTGEPTDDDLWDDLRLAGRGGGELYRMQVSCPMMGDVRDFDQPLPRGDGGPLVLDWTFDPASLLASCTLTSGASTVRHVYTAAERPMYGDVVLLSVVTRSIGYTLSDVLLQRIELWGFEPVPHAATPAEAARRAFLDGQTELALTRVGAVADPDPELALLRALALAELGQREPARQALAALLRRDPGLRSRVPALLVTAPERHAALLREVLGDGYFHAFFEAFGTLLFQHPREPQVLGPLLIWLEGLEARATRGLSADEVEAEIWLLARRGEAARRQGRLTEARRDLDLALRIAAKDPDDQRPERTGMVARAWSEQALVRWALNDRDGAFDALEQALAVAGAPEVFADILAVSPDFAALRREPRWARIEAARRHSAPRVAVPFR
ncbi:MAG: protein kinase [Alphaproteobacteria bacterium]|nr:protein kinase [Alphaproteobacteria bacterium]